MAYNFQDIDPENIDSNQQSDEARKKRLALMANIITGGAGNFTNLLDQYATQRVGQATDKLNQAGEMIQNPEQTVQQRLGVQPEVKPVGPVMPQEVAQQRQPEVLPQQTVEAQQMPQVPVQPQVPEQPVQQVQAQPQAQETVSPVNPEQVTLPQAGPGVQVAGTQPGMGVQQTQPAQQPAQQPAAGQTPDWHDKLAGTDFTGLSTLLANPNTPEDVKIEAQDRMYNMLNDKRMEAKAGQTLQGAASGNPKDISDLSKELSKKSSEGSMLKAMFYSRMGLSELAKDEQAKLGAGQKYTSYTDNNGQHYTVKVDNDGLVTKAFNSEGKQVDDKTLAGLNSSFVANKSAMFTGGSKVYSIQKGQPNEGQEYTSRFNTHTGRFENIVTTGPNAGQIYTGAPGLEKRVETSAAITENKLGASQNLIDYRLQQNLKFAGPMAYTKAGAHYVGRYNAENGTNLGYNTQGVLVDHNNNNQPVVQNRNGNIEAVQRVEKPQAATPQATPGQTQSATVNPAAATTGAPDLTKPPPYNPAMSPRENQKAQDNWAAVQKKTRQDFTTGPQGKTVTAMNTAVAHLDTLNEAGTALYQGQIPVANKVVKEFSTQLGLPEYTNFEGIKHVVGTEVAKAVSGSGQTALADRQAIEKEFDSANSPDQLKGIIKKYQELMGGQLKSQKQTWTGAGLHPDEFDNKLLPRTKKVINQTEAPTRSKW